MRQNKLRNKLYIILILSMIFVINFVTVCAVDTIVPPSGGNVHSGFETRGGEVWNTVKLIIQVVAIGIFLFTGIKYMYASADQKADLKKSLIMTFIGVALVFGLTIVVDFVQDVAAELF